MNADKLPGGGSTQRVLRREWVVVPSSAGKNISRLVCNKEALQNHMFPGEEGLLGTESN